MNRDIISSIVYDPLVTIIIPSYNHCNYIDDAINSVIRQTYERWELIVIDDGSTDGSKDLLSKYKKHEKIRIIFNKENKGQGHVLNRALDISNGEFVGFLPSDDWILPNKLRSQIGKFSNSSQRVGVVYGRGARFFEKDGRIEEPSLNMYRGQILEKII